LEHARARFLQPLHQFLWQLHLLEKIGSQSQRYWRY
jgi:hypothetical protein